MAPIGKNKNRRGYNEKGKGKRREMWLCSVDKVNLTPYRGGPCF